jgi:hypothetical protein
MEKNMQYGLHNNSSTTQLAAREQLVRLFQSRPFSDELLLTNFGLFSRASALAKIFFLHEAYLKIKNIPGDIYVFGVWLGQDIVVLESMRAMIEPYNASRKLVGFDTFEGYVGISALDKTSETIKPEGYTTEKNYQQFLEDLLAYHRQENTLGHAVTHKLISGDVTKTAKEYVEANTSSMVAMAYFDLALYEPTISALNSISDRLMPGSVIVLDELNDPRYPGETIAFREWARDKSYEITRSNILPDRTFVTIKDSQN